jgi:hypothetical protein
MTHERGIMTGQEALNKLLENPKKFLEKHRLKVTAHFADTQQEMVWLYNDGQNYGGHDSFDMANGAKPEHGHPVSLAVFGVRVYDYANIVSTALPAVPLPASGAGPGFMATVMLTGCTVVMQERAGGIGPFVAHILPATGQSGAQLEDALHDAKFTGSTHATKLYGRHQYPGTLSATTIALRDGSSWFLYTQSFGNNEIHEVKKYSLA